MTRAAYGTRGLRPTKGRGVRYRKDTGFEMYCPGCARRGSSVRYWPLDLEFWMSTNLQRCRACLMGEKRAAEKARRVVRRNEMNAKNKAYYHENKSWLGPKNAERNRLWRRARKDQAAA